MMATPASHAYPHLVRILRRLHGDELEPFIADLSLSGLERTTNHVERKNRRFRLLQKTRYKRRKLSSIANAMKLELMHQKHRWEQAHPPAHQASEPQPQGAPDVPSSIAA